MYCFAKICCLCLQYNDNLIVLEATDVHGLTFFDKMLALIPGFEKLATKNIPTYLCKKCKRYLNKLYTFQQNCLKSIKLLESYVNKLDNSSDQIENDLILIQKDMAECLIKMDDDTDDEFDHETVSLGQIDHDSDLRSSNETTPGCDILQVSTPGTEDVPQRRPKLTMNGTTSGDDVLSAVQENEIRSERSSSPEYQFHLSDDSDDEFDHETVSLEQMNHGNDVIDLRSLSPVGLDVLEFLNETTSGCDIPQESTPGPEDVHQGHPKPTINGTTPEDDFKLPQGSPEPITNVTFSNETTLGDPEFTPSGDFLGFDLSNKRKVGSEGSAELKANRKLRENIISGEECSLKRSLENVGLSQGSLKPVLAKKLQSRTAPGDIKDAEHSRDNAEFEFDSTPFKMSERGSADVEVPQDCSEPVLNMKLRSRASFGNIPRESAQSKTDSTPPKKPKRINTDAPEPVGDKRLQNKTVPKSFIDKNREIKRREIGSRDPTIDSKLRKDNKPQRKNKEDPEIFKPKRILNVHKRKHVKRPSMCEICNKTFTRSFDLTIHKRVHSGERPYKCKICKKSFNNVSNLIVHKRVHSGDRPYSCEICNKTFIHSSALSRHKRKHRGDRPYTCEICNKTFIQSSDLKNHTRIHSGERPFACEICNKTFSISSNLKRHKRVHSNERNICRKSVESSPDLKNHQNAEHSNKLPYKCDSCPKSFMRLSLLNGHKKTHNQNLNDSDDSSD